MIGWRKTTDKGSIVVSFKQHGVCQDGGDISRNIINKHAVIPVIQESPLSAEHIRQAQMSLRGQTSMRASRQ